MVLQTFSGHSADNEVGHVFLKFDMVIEYFEIINQIDGLVQERRNSSALAMELRLSYTKPSR